MEIIWNSVQIEIISWSCLWRSVFLLISHAFVTKSNFPLSPGHNFLSTSFVMPSPLRLYGSRSCYRAVLLSLLSFHFIIIYFIFMRCYDMISYSIEARNTKWNYLSLMSPVFFAACRILQLQRITMCTVRSMPNWISLFASHCVSRAPHCYARVRPWLYNIKCNKCARSKQYAIAAWIRASVKAGCEKMVVLTS